MFLIIFYLLFNAFIYFSSFSLISIPIRSSFSSHFHHIFQSFHILFPTFCVRIQLPPGPVTLTFRATGLGVGVSTGEPGACLTLRLDLEISSHKARMGRSWEDWRMLFFYRDSTTYCSWYNRSFWTQKKLESRIFSWWCLGLVSYVGNYHPIAESLSTTACSTSRMI